MVGCGGQGDGGGWGASSIVRAGGGSCAEDWKPSRQGSVSCVPLENAVVVVVMVMVDVAVGVMVSIR
jgi:hypothetical protein